MQISDLVRSPWLAHRARAFDAARGARIAAVAAAFAPSKKQLAAFAAARRRVDLKNASHVASTIFFYRDRGADKRVDRAPKRRRKSRRRMPRSVRKKMRGALFASSSSRTKSRADGREKIARWRSPYVRWARSTQKK